MIGSVPVDSHFHGSGRVLEHNGVIYAATLNQSNIANNNNKFYILQIIEVEGHGYTFFCRWGRVGVPGNTSLMSSNNKDQVIREY